MPKLTKEQKQQKEQCQQPAKNFGNYLDKLKTNTRETRSELHKRSKTLFGIDAVANANQPSTDRLIAIADLWRNKQQWLIQAIAYVVPEQVAIDEKQQYEQLQLTIAATVFQYLLVSKVAIDPIVIESMRHDFIRLLVNKKLRIPPGRNREDDDDDDDAVLQGKEALFRLLLKESPEFVNLSANCWSVGSESLLLFVVVVVVVVEEATAAAATADSSAACIALGNWSSIGLR